MVEKMYSVKEVAAKTGKAIITVRKLVVAHGLGQKIGRDWVLTDADIEVIANVKMGRPTEKSKDVSVGS